MLTLYRILWTATLLLFLPLQAQAAPSLTLDLDNGHVLSHKDAFVPWHPASLTKMMTAFVTFRALEAGEIAPNTPVVVSNRAIQQPASHTGYAKGTVLTVDNALKLLVVKSANDIAVALAETVSGTVPAFAQRMNREARQIGMRNSNFVNPHGLHNARQYMTAYDIAVLAQVLHKRYPQYAHLFASPRVEAPVRIKKAKAMVRANWKSYNLLLERFRGADGLKTGFVCASGYNIAASATRSGRRIATIVLGRISQSQRTVEAARFLALGFQQPLAAGIPLRDLKPTGNEPETPRNLRPEICSKEAWKARYNSKPEFVMKNSPWLTQKTTTRKPLQVFLGNANGPASTTAAEAQLAVLLRVPVPRARPLPPQPIEGLRKSYDASFVPVPAFRPTI